MAQNETQETTELKTLLTTQLQDLLNVENQIAAALPAMVEAAENNKVQEALEKHLVQTQGHAEKVSEALQSLGADADSNGDSEAGAGIRGLIEEAQQSLKKYEDAEDVSDLALIAAVQKVEHYEISAYGTAKCLAKQIGENVVAKTLSRILGEEEAADFLLTSITQPLLEQATSSEYGNGTKMPWGEPGDTSISSRSGASSSRGEFTMVAGAGAGSSSNPRSGSASAERPSRSEQRGGSSRGSSSSSSTSSTNAKSRKGRS
jgi:Mn-containing catalase